MDPRDKTVLVTGAAQGIGRSTALRFASEGSLLALADINVDGLRSVRREIESTGGQAIAIQADVGSENDVSKMVDEAVDRFGRLDILVGNAGIAISGPAEETAIDDWRRIVDVNVWGHVYAIKKVLPMFLSQGSGHLVHLASASGLFGRPMIPAYSMTKFALFGLAESLAVRLHGTGVGVSVVCPLRVATEMMSSFPGKGLIPPERVGKAIVEGVKAEKFLILPHPEVMGMTQDKWSNIERYVDQAGRAFDERGEIFP